MTSLPCKVFLTVACISAVSMGSFSERLKTAREEQTPESGYDTVFDVLINRIDKSVALVTEIQAGKTALASRIAEIEVGSGREKPKPLPLRICDRPRLYKIGENRSLVECSEALETACLDIKKDQENFGGENDLRSLKKNSGFSIGDNIQCSVLRTFED